MATDMNSKRAKGNLGEDIACKYLEKRGFRISCRNYLKKWGEIDIVASKKGSLDFFEVKSVVVSSLSRSGQTDSGYRPEENVHDFKILRLRRTIQSYIAEKGGGPDTGFGFHVLVVRIDQNKRIARVKWIKDVII